MKRTLEVSTLLVCLIFGSSAGLRAQTATASLRGTVTDPSGSAVPAAVVQVVGPRGEQRQGTGANGEYAFASLPSGKYQVRFIAKGFDLGQRPDVEINGPVTLDYQLAIEANAQVLNVEDEANEISVDPSKNADAIEIGQKQIDALSDDPDILQQQLIALAGPGAGPNGGQIYVDGFSGANLPPKSSIQEIRINSNPYSPENENAGGSGIQIITKPGTSSLHGNFQDYYNKEALNSRSPVLTSPKRPPLKQESFNGNLSGSLIKNKLSYTFNFNKNVLTQNAFIYATILDANLNPAPVNQTVLTPRGNWNWQPRVDYAINSKHTLTASFFNGHNHVENLGVGDYGLASRAYNNHGNNNQVQISETWIVSPRMISDNRFQYFRNLNDNTGHISTPSIVVPGAFTGGGGQIGNSGATTNNYELNSSTSYGYKAHTLRWGGRLRESYVNSTSVTNFGGTYTFQGGSGPLLDANYQPIPGSTEDLTALEVYQRTLLLQRQGLNDTAIRALGGGAYQFSLSAGQPTISVKQFDAGLFFVDDWRVRPNVTFSYGARYEVQSNISDHGDWGPRLAVAWNPYTHGKPGKTVLRAGVGAFYSRVPLAVTQNSLRFNGVSQQQFVVISPSFFPAIPSLAALQSGQLPQQIQLTDARMRAPQSWQASIGADHQISKAVRLSVNYTANRGIHLQRTTDINAPLNGVFPFHDSQIRLLTESTGFSRTQQITVTPTINYKRIFLAGFYTLSYGKTDNEGLPADPYNLRAEWGPASQADIRHRATIIFTTPLPTRWLSKFTLTAQASFSSGAPYNIITGRDLNGDSIIAERPSLLTGVGAGACAGSTLIYESQFGCFNLTPAAGTAIGHNPARGPAQENISYAALSRTWVLNPGKEGAAKEGMVTVPGPGGTSITVPASMVGGLNNASGPKRKYNLTFTIQSQNPLNHTTYTAPSGDLSSPYFGVFRSNAFGTTWNRQVSLQLRLNF